MENKLTVLHPSAVVCEGMARDDGTLDVRVMAQTLGALLSGVLRGEIAPQRTIAAVRVIETGIRLADAVRRSGDTSRPLLSVGKNDAD